MTTRIEELHAEIRHRDNRIEELEQELKVKDEIIRRQVIMLSEYQGNKDKQGADEKAKIEKKIKQVKPGLSNSYADAFIQTQCNNLLNLG